jgi:hypothetical protein
MFLDKLNPYMLYIKLAGAAIALLLAGYVGHYVTKAVDDRAYSALELKQSNAETANVSASLDQLKGFISNMHAAGADYQADLAGIRTDFDAIKKDFHNATLKPLPLGCAPTADRVRILQAAVDAANKRAGAGQ